MNKTEILLPILLIFSLSGVSGCKKAKGFEKKKQREFKVAVEVQTVKKRTLQRRRIYTGTAMPWKYAALSFKASGRIRKLKFEEGSFVKKNQVLGIINEEDYWLMHKMAGVQIKALTPDYNRIKKLTAQNAIPGAEWDRIKGKMEAAKTQLMQADSMLSGTILRAPFDGIIEKKNVSVGDMVSPARPAGILLDMSKIKVNLGVTENELGLFKTGKQVSIFIPSLNQKLNGKIHRISYTADPKTRNFTVTITCENPKENNEYLIRAGMLVKVELSPETKTGIFLEPASVMKDTAGKLHVYTVIQGKARKKYVKTGILFDGKLEITSGLNEGENVVTKGARFLKDNISVTIEKINTIEKTKVIPPAQNRFRPLKSVKTGVKSSPSASGLPSPKKDISEKQPVSKVKH